MKNKKEFKDLTIKEKLSGFFVLGVIVLVLFVIFSPSDSNTQSESSEPTPTMTVEASRKKNIEAQFSLWDGSHNKSVELIKDNMNDPKSFEHDETTYFDQENHLIIVTTFRGKNAFGGVITNTIRTKVDVTENGEFVNVNIFE
jgi:hypothetical protein